MSIVKTPTFIISDCESHFTFQATAFLIHRIHSLSPQTYNPHAYPYYVTSEVQSTPLYYEDTIRAPPAHIGMFS